MDFVMMSHSYLDNLHGLTSVFVMKYRHYLHLMDLFEDCLLLNMIVHESVDYEFLLVVHVPFFVYLDYVPQPLHLHHLCLQKLLCSNSWLNMADSESPPSYDQVTQNDHVNDPDRTPNQYSNVPQGMKNQCIYVYICTLCLY